MTTKHRRPKTMRITREPTGGHVVLFGTDPNGKAYPTHDYTEVTKTLNELCGYYLEEFPLVTEIVIKVAIPPPYQRAGRVTPP